MMKSLRESLKFIGGVPNKAVQYYYNRFKTSYSKITNYFGEATEGRNYFTGWLFELNDDDDRLVYVYNHRTDIVSKTEDISWDIAATNPKDSADAFNLLNMVFNGIKIGGTDVVEIVYDLHTGKLKARKIGDSVHYVQSFPKNLKTAAGERYKVDSLEWNDSKKCYIARGSITKIK